MGREAMGREAGGRPGTGWDQAGQQRHSGSAAQPQPWCGAPTGCKSPARPTDAPCLPRLCREGGCTAAGRLKC